MKNQDFRRSFWCLSAKPISTQRQNYFPFAPSQRSPPLPAEVHPKGSHLCKFPPQNRGASVDTFAEVDTGKSLCFQGFLSIKGIFGMLRFCPKEKTSEEASLLLLRFFSVASVLNLCALKWKLVSHFGRFEVALRHSAKPCNFIVPGSLTDCKGQFPKMGPLFL